MGRVGGAGARAAGVRESTPAGPRQHRSMSGRLSDSAARARPQKEKEDSKKGHTPGRLAARLSRGVSARGPAPPTLPPIPALRPAPRHPSPPPPTPPSRTTHAAAVLPCPPARPRLPPPCSPSPPVPLPEAHIVARKFAQSGRPPLFRPGHHHSPVPATARRNGRPVRLPGRRPGRPHHAQCGCRPHAPGQGPAGHPSRRSGGDPAVGRRVLRARRGHPRARRARRLCALGPGRLAGCAWSFASVIGSLCPGRFRQLVCPPGRVAGVGDGVRPARLAGVWRPHAPGGLECRRGGGVGVEGRLGVCLWEGWQCAERAPPFRSHAPLPISHPFPYCPSARRPVPPHVLHPVRSIHPPPSPPGLPGRHRAGHRARPALPPVCVGGRRAGGP